MFGRIYAECISQIKAYFGAEAGASQMMRKLNEWVGKLLFSLEQWENMYERLCGQASYVRGVLCGVGAAFCLFICLFGVRYRRMIYAILGGGSGALLFYAVFTQDMGIFSGRLWLWNTVLFMMILSGILIGHYLGIFFYAVIFSLGVWVILLPYTASSVYFAAGVSLICFFLCLFTRRTALLHTLPVLGALGLCNCLFGSGGFFPYAEWGPSLPFDGVLCLSLLVAILAVYLQSKMNRKYFI